MDYKLELIILPVSDVDVAKEFYTKKMGFNLDVDHKASEDFRVVQVTPPGSACSVTFGVGIGDAEPGSVHGTHLVVEDIEKAHAELSERGVEMDGIRNMGEDGWVDGPHPERADYGSFAAFADPDGNTWTLQEVGYSEASD
ncbi:MAG: VOC family protein [Acidimicrobiia bacterium]|nr:VOC family protein [Acidimicrobiia bacterium]